MSRSSELILFEQRRRKRWMGGNSVSYFRTGSRLQAPGNNWWQKGEGCRSVRIAGKEVSV